MVWEGGFFSSFWDRTWAEEDRKGVFGEGEEGGGVRSGPGAARTILLFHIISARPSKQPRMVRTFLKVCMELGSYFLFLQEQKKDIIIIEHKGLPPRDVVYVAIELRFRPDSLRF
jgi:hypothetical protein